MTGGARRGRPGAGAVRRAVAGTAVVALGAYAVTKVAWIGGGAIGIGGPAEVARGRWTVDNVVTGALGLVGVVVAVMAARPPVPGWLRAVPRWVGLGPVAPFAALVPVLAALAGFGALPGGYPWVLVAGYAGLVAAGLTLLVVLLDRVVALPALAWTAALVAAVPAAAHLYWLCGGTTGLADGRSGWLRMDDALRAAQLLLGAGGLLALVHRLVRQPRAAGRALALPLLATWIGAGGMVGSGLRGIPAVLGAAAVPDGERFVVEAGGAFGMCVAGCLVSAGALVALIDRAEIPGGRRGDGSAPGSIATSRHARAGRRAGAGPRGCVRGPAGCA